MEKFFSLIFLLFCACQTSNNVIISSHKIKNVRINIVKDVKTINKIYDGEVKAYAFYDPKKRTIWVPENGIKDQNGKTMPNLFLLGHEIWHVIEPNYHSNTNVNYSFPVMPEFDVILIRK